MMHADSQGVDPRVDLISRRLQQMQEMAAMSGHGHGDHGGDADGHGHSHGGQSCDGHSHDPVRMNMILERMQKFVAMQAQGAEAGETTGMENQARAMQAMQMIQQLQSGGGLPMGGGDGGHGHSHGGPSGDSYQHSLGGSSERFQNVEPTDDEHKLQLMSGDIAANAPHRQKNWISYTGEQGTGPKDSFLHGGGHFSPPEFGWGALIKDPQPSLEEKPKPQNHGHSHGAAKSGPFAFLESKGLKMPHETDTTGSIIQVTLPLLGRIRFLTDIQGLVFWAIVVLYWIIGNYSTWFCILLPQYSDGKLSIMWLLTYGIVSLLCITSHWKASTINPGRIPYFVEENSIDHPDWSFCHQCQRKRPPRAHHCRRCKQCVLKMDHHCPWINNCVGEDNQWAFVLLVVYAQLLSSYSLALNSLWYWRMEPCQSCDPTSFTIFHSRALVNTVTVLAVLMIFFSLGLLCSQNMGVLLDYTTLEWMQLERTFSSSGKMPEDMPRVKKNICLSYRKLCGDTLFIFWPFPCRRRIAPAMKRMEDV